MFDWIKKLLFEEEEVVVEENKLEEIDFTKVNDLENVLSEEEKVEVKVATEVKRVEEDPQVEYKKEDVPLKKEFNIQINEPTPLKPQEEPVEYKRRRTDRSYEEPKVEVAHVISPMFGGKNDKKVEPKVHVVTQPKKKDGVGIVISPMYGQSELNEHKKEAETKIEENKNKVNPMIEDDDWKNDIPLDELISSEEETNDCVQFSLFGDNQTINE